MEDEVKQVVNDIKAGVIEAVTPAITKAVMENVEEQMKSQRAIHGADGDDVAEKKQKAVDYLKAKFVGNAVVAKDLSGGESTAGEELVPEYFSNEILRIIPTYGVIRRNARVVPMGGKKLTYPTLGSVVAYRVGEKEAITSSAPTTGNVTLEVQKLAVMIPTSNELLRDANIAVVDQLAKLSAEALAKKEDEWGFLGLAGTEGIFRNTSVPVHNLGSGDTDYNDVDFDDLLGMLDLVDEDALAGMKWYMSFSVWNALRAKKASTSEEYIFQMPQGGQPASIWNIPVEFSKVLPKTTQQTSQANADFIVLGNLDHMFFGDRGEYSVDISNQATVTSTDGTTPVNLFEQDMSAVRVIERVDIELTEADKAYAVAHTATS